MMMMMTTTSILLLLLLLLLLTLVLQLLRSHRLMDDLASRILEVSEGEQ